MGEGSTAINREIVADFVELFYRQRQVRLAFQKHVGDTYIQHNPNILDGREAAITMLEPVFSGATFDIKRVLVDGNLAAVHLYGCRAGQQFGNAVVDLFRLEDGKIVEHWDVLQPVPERSANPRTMV
jgi:predicted SnoaL-like aldol condensation-catalyzing enzyme